MVRIQVSDGLDLHQDGIRHRKVRDVRADGYTVVFNSDGDLLPDHEAGFRQLVRQGIFVNLFWGSRAELAVSALDMAIDNRNVTPGEPVHHSDQGVQYACGDY